MKSKVFDLSNKRNNIWEEKKKQKNCSERQMNLRLTIQSICVIFCSICFIYQTTQLVTIYLSGHTVVENRVQRFKYSKVPAVTVCLPTIYSMIRYAQVHFKNDQEKRQLYEEVLEFGLKTVDNQKLMNNDKIKDYQEQLFNKVFKEFNKGKHHYYTKLNDLFTNVSSDDILQIVQHGYGFNESGQFLPNMPLPRPLRSIVPFGDPRLCYTFFSDFDEIYRNFNVSLVYFRLQLNLSPLSFPLKLIKNEDGELYIALHSHNILPEFLRDNIFHPLEMSVVNFVTYSESKSILLPSPYLTKCKNYEIDVNGTTDMRSDCIDKCVNDKLYEEYGLDCIWTNENFRLVRKDNLREYGSRTLCDPDDQRWAKEWYQIDRRDIVLRSECEDKCPKNCLESYYTYEVVTRRYKKYNYQKDHNQFHIDLAHNSYPDQVIEHRPIMDWITMVSNLGGLLGMWLGLSVMFVCNLFLERIIKV